MIAMDCQVLVGINLWWFSGTGVAADTAASRIMELSKKNRELTADLESERSKVRQLAKKSQEMEKEVIISIIDDPQFWVLLM